MDFNIKTEELNNKTVITVFEKESTSYKKFGPQFIGRLVGRTIDKSNGLTKTVVSLTILAQNFITYQIPCADVQFISEIFL
jgi:hypothetical protein